MATPAKLLLATVSAAALLGGCAAGPYYDGYGYDSGYDRGYAYDPYYNGPAVGFGYAYSDRDRRDYYRDRDRDGRWRDNQWREQAQRERRNEPMVSREQQHRDDITQGIAPPDNPSQDIGQYSR